MMEADTNKINAVQEKDQDPKIQTQKTQEKKIQSLKMQTNIIQTQKMQEKKIPSLKMQTQKIQEKKIQSQKMQVQKIQQYKVQRQKAGRLAGLDTIRGITLLSMMLYHTCWDLVFLFGKKIPGYSGLGGYVWQQSICWTFILLAGFCWSLGSHHLKRGLIVSGSGISDYVRYLTGNAGKQSHIWRAYPDWKLHASADPHGKASAEATRGNRSCREFSVVSSFSKCKYRLSGIRKLEYT